MYISRRVLLVGLLILIAAAVGGWEYTQHIRQRAVEEYLLMPVGKDEKGTDVSRAQLLDIILKERFTKKE